MVAMQNELNNFKRNKVWSLVERRRKNVVGTKWVFCNKQDEFGVVKRNKARLVAKGYSQVKCLDFKETSGLVARLESIRILLAYPTHYDLKRHKALYGLKQAPRAWYEWLRDFLTQNGFKIGKAGSTLFTRKVDKDLFIYQIYIDDIIFGSTNQSFCDEFSKIMIDRFEMSMMGELMFFLGFQIKQLEDETFLSQYTHDILKKFGMDKAKPIKTLMGINEHLDLDMGGKLMDQKVYYSMIGSLLYLCASRPNIMLSVCMCARFQAAPKECHMRVVKRIMRYLVLTLNLGLWYPLF
jgi:hypothetical protein